MILIDFDKTLTYRDTLLGFFITVCKTYKYKFIFFPFYFLSMILLKLKIINNDKFKQIGIYFFLKNISKKKYQKFSVEYSKKIKLNKLFYKLKKCNEKKIIVTASFQEYVSQCVGNKFIVHGTKLNYNDNKIAGLKLNMYGNLKGNYITKYYKNSNFDSCYSDSLSDISIFKLAKNKYLVNNEKIKKIDI